MCVVYCYNNLFNSFDYGTPYIVKLGVGRIIAGMDRGLEGTCLWERRRITLPPELGYGSRGAGKDIPPDATLIFYIRMIKIEKVWDSTLYNITCILKVHTCNYVCVCMFDKIKSRYYFTCIYG